MRVGVFKIVVAAALAGAVIATGAARRARRATGQRAESAAGVRDGAVVSLAVPADASATFPAHAPAGDVKLVEDDFFGAHKKAPTTKNSANGLFSLMQLRSFLLKCRGWLDERDGEWSGTPMIAWYKGTVLRGEGMLGYGVLDLVKRTHHSSALALDDIADWRGEVNCKNMASGLTWTQSDPDNKLCIPIVEDGANRALRLDVPPPKNKRKLPTDDRKQEAGNRHLALSQTIVNFYRKCSAVYKLEQAAEAEERRTSALKQHIDGHIAAIEMLERQIRDIGHQESVEDKKHDDLNSENYNLLKDRDTQNKLLTYIKTALDTRQRFVNEQLSIAAKRLHEMAVESGDVPEQTLREPDDFKSIISSIAAIGDKLVKVAATTTKKNALDLEDARKKAEFAKHLQQMMPRVPTAGITAGDSNRDIPSKSVRMNYVPTTNVVVTKSTNNDPTFYAVTADFESDSAQSCAFRRNEHFKSFLREFFLAAVDAQAAFVDMVESKVSEAKSNERIMTGLSEFTSLFSTTRVAVESSTTAKKKKSISALTELKAEELPGKERINLVFDKNTGKQGTASAASAIFTAVKLTEKNFKIKGDLKEKRATAFAAALNICNRVFQHMYRMNFILNLGKNGDDLGAEIIYSSYPAYYGSASGATSTTLNTNTKNLFTKYMTALQPLAAALNRFYFPILKDVNKALADKGYLTITSGYNKRNVNPFWESPPLDLATKTDLTIIPKFWGQGDEKSFNFNVLFVTYKNKDIAHYATPNFVNLGGKVSAGLSADASIALALTHCLATKKTENGGGTPPTDIIPQSVTTAQIAQTPVTKKASSQLPESASHAVVKGLQKDATLSVSVATTPATAPATTPATAPVKKKKQGFFTKLFSSSSPKVSGTTAVSLSLTDCTDNDKFSPFLAAQDIAQKNFQPVQQVPAYGYNNPEYRCYINAALQVLARAPGFRAALRQTTARQGAPLSPLETAEAALVSTLSRALEFAPRDATVVRKIDDQDPPSTDAIINALRNVNPNNPNPNPGIVFDGSTQEDTSEFVSALLDAIERVGSTTPYDANSLPGDHSYAVSPIKLELSNFVQETISCMNPSYAEKANCKLERDVRVRVPLVGVRDKSVDLQMVLSKMAAGVDEVQDEELDQCMKPNRIEKINCLDHNVDKTKTSCGQKQSKIVRWPNTLIVDLNRLDMFRNKHTVPVIIGEEIVINHGLSSYQYKLVGMTVHRGQDGNSGHYVAIVPCAASMAKGWQTISDSIVSSKCESLSNLKEAQTNSFTVVYSRIS